MKTVIIRRLIFTPFLLISFINIKGRKAIYLLRYSINIIFITILLIVVCSNSWAAERHVLNRGIISGRCFYDENSNNIFDQGEAFLSKIKITLKRNSLSGLQDYQNTQTGIDGSYSFTDLKPGLYEISVDPDEEKFITPESLSMWIGFSGAASQSMETNFGLQFLFPLIYVNIEAYSDMISAGNISQISWKTEKAEHVIIDQGIGEVELSGSLHVSPIVTTTYTITAINGDCKVSDSVTLIVLDLNEDNDTNEQCGPVFKENDDYLGDPNIYPSETSMQPGETRQFNIVRWQCCVFPVNAESTPCIEWFVEPDSAGKIGNDGLFELSDNAEPGQQVAIIALFPDPSFSYRATVNVYTREANPLVGGWYEEWAIACDVNHGIKHGSINELIFKANGDFSVTWFPFEVYIDYWGYYAYDVQTGRLSMTITGGNYIPDTDLEGIATLQADGSILLDGIYFGSPPVDEEAERNCGYVIRLSYGF